MMLTLLYLKDIANLESWQ